MRGCYVSCVAAILAISGQIVFGSDEQFAIRFSEESGTVARASLRAITDEITTLNNHEWAGQYFFGDGRGVNVSLAIAPKSGFVFTWRGRWGLYDRNYGAVTSKKDTIRLTFKFENKRDGFRGLAEELFPVVWGDRRYLIPADDVVGFCNAVNDGSEPRKNARGDYLLRQGDEGKTAKGSPTLPQRFKAYLLPRPIQATITSIGMRTTRMGIRPVTFVDTIVTLKPGRKQGLLPGMDLHLLKPADYVETVRITKVEEEQSEGVMTQVGTDEPRPKVGWTFSTRCRWFDGAGSQNDAARKRGSQ
jgi:hypothetical protein